MTESPQAIEYAAQWLQTDEDFLQQMYLVNPKIIYYSTTVIQSRKIALSTIDNFEYFAHFSKEILHDRDVALELLNHTHLHIRYFSSGIQNDAEIIYLYILQSPLMLRKEMGEKITMITKKHLNKLKKPEVLQALKSRILKFTCFAMHAKDVSIKFV